MPWKGGSPVSGSGRGSGGRQEVLLSGLAKFRKFGVVVQAYNSRGPGPLSKEIVALTLEDGELIFLLDKRSPAAVELFFSHPAGIKAPLF